MLQDEDPRVQAFCDPQGPEVFHSVEHRHEIWKRDPFDVETIHTEARDVFQRLLDRLTTPPGSPFGRSLLILGEAGSGKTHLMRVFRNHVHGRRLGYCGYMQMSSRTDNYGRYMLGNLIDSLSEPYDKPANEDSGLITLANAVVELSGAMKQEEIERLHEDDFTPEALGEYINRLTDRLLAHDPWYADQDVVGVLRALLYLQRNDAPLRARVLRYLRCQDLSSYEQRLLGEMSPRLGEEEPLRMIAQLGKVIWRVQGASLVLFLDQLEDIFNLDDHKNQFQRAMDAVNHVIGHVPSAIVVISCLEDFYSTLKQFLSRAVLDRIEKDPGPLLLLSQRSQGEIQALVAKRLCYLYASLDVPYSEAQPTFPIPEEQLAKFTVFRTRDVLDWCRDYQQSCIDAGRVIDPVTTSVGGGRRGTGDEQPITLMEQEWNDFRVNHPGDLPNQDSELVKLLAWSIHACSEEVGTGHTFVAEPDNLMVTVSIEPSQNTSGHLLIGLCNHRAQGGGLSRQVRAVEERAGTLFTPVLVRCSEFPGNPRTQIARQIGQFLTRGGWRVVAEDADWRAMLAFLTFHKQKHREPVFAVWRRAEQPLCRLKSLQQILNLDTLKPVPKATQPVSKPLESRTAPGLQKSDALPVVGQSLDTEVGSDTGSIVVGNTGGITTEQVTLEPHTLMQHAAFLGSTGSGKTTVALNIIEQLLLQGVPAVLVDRKGDLCRYADKAWWATPHADPELHQRKQRLHAHIAVALYTPGDPAGRSLTIPLGCQGMGLLPAIERNQMANYTASALAGMMGYKDNPSDDARKVILAKGLELLCQVNLTSDVSLEQLVDLIYSEDPALINTIGKLDTKHFARLVQDLETLRLSKGMLLSAESEQLNVEALLGIGPDATATKTRLSIISTKFLGDNTSIEFWVSRLLAEIARWASKHPSPSLQAILMFDEADIYLPAMGKPATKEPLLDLLKRARSAGVGVFLATQSPGDLDYKSRDNILTWFVGKVTQKTAIDKMKPLLSEGKVDVAAKLPLQGTGEFYRLCGGKVTNLRMGRSAMETKQLSEGEILDLAQDTAARTYS